MPADMGRDLGHLHPVDLVVLLSDVLKILFPVHRHHGHPVLIHVKEANPSIHHWLNFRLFPLCKDSAETLVHIILHGKDPRTCIRLRRINYDILHVRSALKLMIDIDGTSVQINILNGESTEFRNSHSGMK